MMEKRKDIKIKILGSKREIKLFRNKLISLPIVQNNLLFKIDTQRFKTMVSEKLAF